MYVSHLIVKAILEFNAMTYYNDPSSGKKAVEHQITTAASNALAAIERLAPSKGLAAISAFTPEAQELLKMCEEEINSQTKKPIFEYLLHSTLIEREHLLRGYLAFILYEKAGEIIIKRFVYSP